MRNRIWQLVPAACLAAALLASPGAGTALANGARADDREPVERGRAIAAAQCARCHSIEKTGDSPLPIAPPLREFAARWPLDQLEEAFAEGIITGHPDMPQFVFQPDDIAALIVFLDWVAEHEEAR